MTMKNFQRKKITSCDKIKVFVPFPFQLSCPFKTTVHNFDSIRVNFN